MTIMPKITSAGGLKDAILVLETENALKKKQLEEQFDLVYGRFKPLNLITGAFREVTSSPTLLSTVLSTGLGLAGGFVAKKIITAGSAGVFRKLFGSVVQHEVTRVIARHPETINSAGYFLLHKLLRSKRKQRRNRDS